MNKSEVVKFDKLIVPILEALKVLGGSGTNSEIDLKVIDIMRLPDEMCDILHNENRSQTEVEYRLAWARTYLKKVGIIENSSRSVWSFSENFNGNIEDISSSEILKEVRLNKTENNEKIKLFKKEETDEDYDIETTKFRKPWKDVLREVLLSMTPDAFERLTLRILRESGFTQVIVTGQTNDHGIDGKGIIQLNGIMSFHMLFQCKRYKGSVSASEIRDFRGAMQGRADRGLFITTGSFTSEAKKEATRDGAPALDLIDGESLMERLKDLGLGIEEKIIRDYEIDVEWFTKI